MTNPYQGPFEPAHWRNTIWSITSVFESGSPEGDPTAYQNYDSGIISFGKHQATLASGNLARILEIYFTRSHSETRQILRDEYWERIRNRDASLRNDNRLRDLLIQAAGETAMREAQDEVFDKYFYQPAVSRAAGMNIRSPLGLAVIYDTFIQGGLTSVTGLLASELGGSIVGQNGIEEPVWIATFLDKREIFLNRIAQKAEDDGRLADANALRISVFRVREFKSLVQAGNYGLSGTFVVRGHPIQGIQPCVETPAVVNDVKVIQHGKTILNLTPRRTFTATFRLRNTGTTTWNENYKIAYVHGAGKNLLADKFIFKFSEVSTVCPVSPGSGTVIGIKMRAPRKIGGRYKTEWQILDEQSRPFGEKLVLELFVQEKLYE